MPVKILWQSNDLRNFHMTQTEVIMKRSRNIKYILKEERNVKVKVVPMFNLGLRHEELWRGEGIAPRILILGIT
jgi:hypothetical protein